MEYHIAVPSYRRAEMFGKKTLRFLRASGAPNPTVYVADQQDYDAYKALYPELEIVIAVPGLCAARNWIQDHLPLGQKIMFLDDDINEIYCLDFTSSRKMKKNKIRNFPEFVRIGFECAALCGTTFWGVYPTDHTLGLKPGVRRNLCYCVGACYGIINSRIPVTLDYAEDFERCLTYWEKEKCLCRLEFIGVNTNYYTNEGGLQETRNEILNTEYKHQLAERFPHLCKVIQKRGKTELSLRRFPANFLMVRYFL